MTPSLLLTRELDFPADFRSGFPLCGEFQYPVTHTQIFNKVVVEAVHVPVPTD